MSLRHLKNHRPDTTVDYYNLHKGLIKAKGVVHSGVPVEQHMTDASDLIVNKDYGTAKDNWLAIAGNVTSDIAKDPNNPTPEEYTKIGDTLKYHAESPDIHPELSDALHWHGDIHHKQGRGMDFQSARDATDSEHGKSPKMLNYSSIPAVSGGERVWT